MPTPVALHSGFCLNGNKYDKTCFELKNLYDSLHIRTSRKSTFYINNILFNHKQNIDIDNSLYSKSTEQKRKYRQLANQSNKYEKTKCNEIQQPQERKQRGGQEQDDGQKTKETDNASATNPQLEPHITIVEHIINDYAHLLYNSNSEIMKIDKEVENRKEKIRKNMREATADDIMYGGFLNIYKPANLYSMKVCEKVKNILKEYFSDLNVTDINVKVGHGGTLDPFAEGVLIIGIQKGTKKLYDFLKCYKKYMALSIWGFETNTLDREGKIIKQKVFNNNRNMIDEEDITKCVQNFVGFIDQIPPIFSAKKVKGKRLYEYARKNISVPIKSQKVHIQSIKYLRQVPFPFFDLQITCSGGTYIRSLIRDIANSLNNYATLIKLIRTHQNQYSYKESLHYDLLNMENIKRHFIKL